MSLTATPRRLATVPRIRAIGRAELLLFWRNRLALVNALLVPVLIIGAVASANVDSGAGRDGALRGNALLTIGLLGFVLVGVVYYNLVATYVARREEKVLKRLRVGEVTDVLRLLPLTPAVELMRLGWLGTTGEGARRGFVGVLSVATAPALTLAVWAALGVAAVRRWFRWEPRR